MWPAIWPLFWPGSGRPVGSTSRLWPRPHRPRPAPAPPRRSGSGRRSGASAQPPAGFDTCAYDSGRKWPKLAGSRASTSSWRSTSFSTAARAAPDTAAADDLRRRPCRRCDRSSTDGGPGPSSTVRCGSNPRSTGCAPKGGYDAFAIRCWPETFTEYGGAVCGPVGDDGRRRACPAPAKRMSTARLSQLLLQARRHDAPVFLVDLVDMDTADDDTACCLALRAGAAVDARRSVGGAPCRDHSHQSQGCRCSMSSRSGRGAVTLCCGSARPLASTQKLVISFDRRDAAPAARCPTPAPRGWSASTGNAGAVLDGDMIDSGLEHHMALAYGDHARGAASRGGRARPWGFWR